MSLFRKYGESLLDQPIGIEESRVRQQKEGEVRGNMQEQKRYQRVARRAYRQAMRSKNFGGAMDALDWIDKKAGGMESGITVHGTRQDMARNPAGNGLLPPGGAANPAWDQDGNGIPNSIQLPGAEVASTQPAASPGSNLQQRLGLFAEMKTAAASGSDLSEFMVRAGKLGIDRSGFSRGANKAFGFESAPSLDSPSFSSRLEKFGMFGKYPNSITI